MLPLTIRRHRHAHLRPHGPRASTAHVLAYIEGGELHMDQGGRLRATAGTLLLSPAGVSHRALGGDDLTIRMVGFVPSSHGLHEGLPLMRPFRRVRNGALPKVAVSPSRQAHIIQLMEDLAVEVDAGGPESPTLQRAGLQLLLGEALRAMPRTEARAPSLSSQVLGFVQQHAFDAISLHDVAAAVHRSPGHVATVVKRETGRTVGEWIAATRLAEAAARLKHTDDAVACIGERVGWPDPTHFIRRFRAHFGVTPSVWRTRVAGPHSDMHG